MTFRRFLVGLMLVLPAASFADQPPALDFNTMSRDASVSADCAVTFDDGPGPHTDALLDLLKERQIKATFFVLGEHARHYPDTIRRMVAEGHEVENHSWDHPDMRKLDEAARQKEMEDTVTLLKSLGVTPHYFRPPYGAYDPALVQQAHQDGLEVVLWTRDSIDWRYHTVAQLEGDILPKGEGAHGVFLFHDIHDSTIAAMPAVLDDLKSKGCHFATVAQWAEDSDRRRAAAPQLATVPKAEPKPGISSWLKKLW
ncbi:MAG TPA: polysaccharide deacetylase family protein [Candidatus Sulfotelmatobacter sp.]|jgi:peptidoglycan/xylan/chitin deacetylase (PgdA/CDA1 family)|nr:polysaccharide deacetylase family protein [Candidatus Sulfotelmatobacter sp.]